MPSLRCTHDVEPCPCSSRAQRPCRRARRGILRRPRRRRRRRCRLRGCPCGSRARPVSCRKSTISLISLSLTRPPCRRCRCEVPGRHVERVAVAEQAVGADRVENRARIRTRGDLERDARREVRLDEAGDHVDRRALGGDDQVDAGGARLLREARDRPTSTSRPTVIIRSASSSMMTTMRGRCSWRRPSSAAASSSSPIRHPPRPRRRLPPRRLVLFLDPASYSSPSALRSSSSSCLVRRFAPSLRRCAWL